MSAVFSASLLSATMTVVATNAMAMVSKEVSDLDKETFDISDEAMEKIMTALQNRNVRDAVNQAILMANSWGNQDSTNSSGSGAYACHHVCYSNCHSACHGSRSWR